MFKYNLDYINLIHLSNVKGNPAKSKITYYFDGKIETQTFADSSEYDDAMDALADKFVAIGDSLYNPDRISIANVNGLSVTFYFVGNKIIAETYADQADVDDIVQKIDATHVEVAPNKWISGKQLHVAAVNEALWKSNMNTSAEKSLTWFTKTRPLMTPPLKSSKASEKAVVAVVLRKLRHQRLCLPVVKLNLEQKLQLLVLQKVLQSIIQQMVLHQQALRRHTLRRLRSTPTLQSRRLRLRPK